MFEPIIDDQIKIMPWDSLDFRAIFPFWARNIQFPQAQNVAC